MASNTNTIRMPFLPTVPLPVNVVSTGMLYMYSCSQCDFKTHIEGMFKQHVDSIHLGITTVSNNIVLSNSVATIAAAMPQSSLTGQPQTLVMTTSPVTSVGGQSLTAAIAQTQIVDQKHKCLKCGFLAPSKNQLTQHKRKFHGKNSTAPAPQYQQAIVQTQVQQQPQQQPQQQQPQPQAPQPQPPQPQQQQQQQQQQQPQQQQIVAIQLPSGTNASGKKTYTCQSCGYSTTRRDGLSQHYDSVHLKIKNHQCDLCPYAASQKGTLNRHVKLRHKKKDITQGGQANAS